MNFTDLYQHSRLCLVSAFNGLLRALAKLPSLCVGGVFTGVSRFSFLILYIRCLNLSSCDFYYHSHRHRIEYAVA